MAQRWGKQERMRHLGKSQGLSVRCTQELLGETSGGEVDVAAIPNSGDNAMSS